MKNRFFLLTAVLILFSLPHYSADIVTYGMVNGTQRLVRNGKPILMLAGELHNSQSATLAPLESSVRTAKQMGMNSVIATVSWENLEPREGEFDYTEIDNILSMAEKYDMLLGICWFGSWKNGKSSYTPLWVKGDVKRFPRVRDAKGRNLNTISPFSNEACKSDANAFAKLMAHIKSRDTEGRVCVVQVNNEVGCFTDIDHGKTSLELFESAVPAQLTQYLKAHHKTLSPTLKKCWEENGSKTSGTWKQLFGDNFYAKEFFMAWYFAQYQEKIATSGKAVWPLPMYVNCWMAGDDDDPALGRFPNGGPRPLVYDIYKAAASHIDWLSDDIYENNFHKVATQFHRPENPIFIPEFQRKAGPAWYWFGEHNAMCFSPFGFEEVYDDDLFRGEYQLLNEILPTISQNQGTGRMRGFVRQEGVDAPDGTLDLHLGDYVFTVHYLKGERNAHGIIIQTGPTEFLVAGVGAYITFQAKKKNTICMIARTEELVFKEHKMETLYILNGDETADNEKLYLRGRSLDWGQNARPGEQPPIWEPSVQRMYWDVIENTRKVSGLYRISLYTIPVE